MKEYRILDLFCGAGGMSCGMDMVEGFSTQVAMDFNAPALKTFQHNFPNAKCICGDICDESIKQIVVKESLERNVNMIIGGPPCQGFSMKGKKKGLDDPRNFLFLEYVDLVKRIKPKVFVIENVKAMANSCSGYFMQQIYIEFQKLGYALNHGILSAYDFGVPQTRERTIIIGLLNSEPITMPNNSVTKKVNVRDAISDLAYLNSGDGDVVAEYISEPLSDYQKLMRANSTLLHNHVATNHSAIAIGKLKTIPPEGNKSAWTKEQMGRQLFKTTWGRLVWDKPSPTIDTRFDTPSNGTNSHPTLHRAITPREAARIQSFPDTFIFLGNKTSICKQIGNAVPPLLANAIATHIQQNTQDL